MPITDTPETPDRERMLEALIREHRAAVLTRTIQFTAGDAAWAEDVVQETFIRAWHHIDRMTEDFGSVRSWLLRVAHNVAVDGYRGRRTQFIDIDQSELLLPPAGDASEKVLTAMVVESTLSTLSAGHRITLEETYLRDKTVLEAARELDLPVGTVKSRVFYALRQLRSTVAEWPPAERLG